MKKEIVCLLLTALLISLCALSMAEYTAGTYTGTTPNGRNGAISVEVTLSDNAIEGIRVTEHGETPFVSDTALDKIPERIVETQSLKVDTVTGATITSYAVIAAVRDALTQAEADLDALNTAPPAQEKAPEINEMDADIVIVGAGAAGSMMAVCTAELHPEKKIILLEKTANIGGNAVVSGGYIGVFNPPESVACESSEGLTEMLMEQFKVETVDAFSAQLLEEAKAEYQKYLQGDTRFIFMSPTLSLLYGYLEYPLDKTHELQREAEFKTDDMFMWFYNRGAHFAKMLGVAGYSYPDSTYLEDYYSGAGFFEIFREAMAEHENLILMTEMPATEILIENGSVCGVIATNRHGDQYVIHADSVVMATGGYAADAKRVKETDTYWGERLPEVLLSDNISGTNSQAMDMAVAAGAATDNLGFTQLFPFANPRTGECHDLVGMDGILVNQAGKRTVDETSNRQVLSDAILSEENDIMWLISDAEISWIEDGVNMFGQDVQTMLDRGYLFKADTLEDLAVAASIDPQGLLATVKA